MKWYQGNLQNEKLTQDQIDEISIIATEMIAAEFEEFNNGNVSPSDITPGIVRNVLAAVDKINQ